MPPAPACSLTLLSALLCSNLQPTAILKPLHAPVPPPPAPSPLPVKGLKIDGRARLCHNAFKLITGATVATRC
ncbi:unnamed protein product [Tilletia controversa]|uniref:Secreted protein n=2 Tax=Tilletia TaxID=13289 RepID=A0A8X7MPM4_9BASI|nr:hypothetical protein CF336_g8278 [Tilletia laevis]KAE8242732.1 hypothetical protein A4X03_0g7981 [Tilletia caries]KAE8243802.1 hypothetical protein A4X06_0g6100 [Tilletia controversa]KAE8184733.1 hypothetical protein CF335_g7935 [Tilletia laevis]CAD6886705.1 unnamed protein product [Tilletia caries]